MSLQVSRIAVCLTEESFNKLRFLDAPDTLFICDFVPGCALQGRLEKPLSAEVEIDIAKEIRIWFDKLCTGIGDKAVLGYLNNFFEASIAPILGFVLRLEQALLGLEVDSVEVWVFTRYLTLYRTSCYYMAEHESQGRRLYDREAVMTPYLIYFCRNRGIRMRYIRTRWMGVQPFFNFIRVWSVFCVRFFSEFVRSVCVLRANKVINDKTAGNSDLFVVSRTTNQSETVAGFLALSGLNATFLAGESFLDRGKNYRLLAGIAARFRNIFVMPLPLRSFLWLLKDYFWAAIKILTYTPPAFVFLGHKVIVKQSIKELLVMLPELIGYRRKLGETLASIPRPKWNLLLSLEQKSPHAFVDACVAHRANLTCVHVMQCDQNARPLPWPVFGDYFLTDTQSTATKLREVARESANRINYIGSFKSFVVPRDSYRFEPGISTERIRLCFFTHSDCIDSNIMILQFLWNTLARNRFDVTVKLHPRDSGRNYGAYHSFKIVTDGITERSLFFDTFDIAISFPSGVINELIFRNKPFVLLGFSAGRNANNYDYWDESYCGSVTSIEALSEVIVNCRQLIQSFDLYRNSYLYRAGVASDLNTMCSTLQNLAYRK